MHNWKALVLNKGNIERKKSMAIKIDTMKKHELEKLRTDIDYRLKDLDTESDGWKTDKQMITLIKEHKAMARPVKIKVDMMVPIKGEIEISNNPDDYGDFCFYPYFKIGENFEEIFNIVKCEDIYEFDEEKFRKYFVEADNIRREKEKGLKEIEKRMEKRVKELNGDVDEMYDYVYGY